MEYVIKNDRLKEYLYCLGFDYRTKTDRYDKNKCIYLFPNTELLQKAITFYGEVRNKQNF